MANIKKMKLGEILGTGVMTLAVALMAMPAAASAQASGQGWNQQRSGDSSRGRGNGGNPNRGVRQERPSFEGPRRSQAEAAPRVSNQGRGYERANRPPQQQPNRVVTNRGDSRPSGNQQPVRGGSWNAPVVQQTPTQPTINRGSRDNNGSWRNNSGQGSTYRNGVRDGRNQDNWRDNRQQNNAYRDGVRDGRTQDNWRDRDRNDSNRDGYRNGRDRNDWRDNRNQNDWRGQNRGNDWRGQNRGNGNDWRSNQRYSRDRDRGNWSRNWRNDNRYNWQNFRTSNRNHYRLGSYYAPYRNYSYRRVGIGFSLNSLFYGQRYWISDPWSYRLPEVYGPYRWVRYYDDVLLIDTFSGEVVDVIYDFFW